MLPKHNSLELAIKLWDFFYFRPRLWCKYSFSFFAHNLNEWMFFSNWYSVHDVFVLVGINKPRRTWDHSLPFDLAPLNQNETFQARITTPWDHLFYQNKRPDCVWQRNWDLINFKSQVPTIRPAIHRLMIQWLKGLNTEKKIRTWLVRNSSLRSSQNKFTWFAASSSLDLLCWVFAVMISSVCTCSWHGWL